MIPKFFENKVDDIRCNIEGAAELVYSLFPIIIIIVIIISIIMYYYYYLFFIFFAPARTNPAG